MIFLDKRVPANGPTNARLAIIGMAPARQEIATGIPFTGPSGRILNEALAACKINRVSVYVTNLCNFFIDDNDLYSVPKEVMDREIQRVYGEIDTVKPNVLLILGGDTLWFLTGKKGIQKWRGSIFTLSLPQGRLQKCIAAMHPASFIRGQWKWLPVFKYIDVPKAATQSLSPAMTITPRRAIVGPSFRVACDYLTEANAQPRISIDYEGRSHITCLGVGWSTHEAICIPLSRVGSSSYWTLQEESHLWSLWSRLLENPKVEKIAQNAAYEWIKSWIYGIYPNPLGADTMHMHHCLYPDFGGITDEWTKKKRDIDNPGHGLAFITSQYTDQPFYKDEGRHWRPELGEESFWNYNALDVMVTFEAYVKMRAELESAGLWETYCQNYRDVFEHTIRMEWQGLAVDVVRRAIVKAEKLAEITTVSQTLWGLTNLEVITKTVKGGKPKAGVLNLASPAQMRDWLTKVKHYKLRLNRKTGKPTTDKDTLQALAIAHNDESLSLIMQMKQAQDLINDVMEAPLDEVNRIHCHWKLGGTNGTRWSSSESILGTGTNLQNLPRRGPARSLFIPN